MSAPSALADPPGGDIDVGGESDDDGASNSGTLTEKQTTDLTVAAPAGDGSGASGGGAARTKAVLYEYTISGTCGHSPTSNAECAGQRSRNAACEAAGEPGPMASIWRRQVSFSGPVSGWQFVGQTCFPDDVPGGDNNPQITLAMIRNAWVHTPFAKPQMSMQPVGNKTLVTLPVYYRINWPTAGFAPDEIRTVTLLGHSLRIKPTFQTNTYSFGDGSSAGPTRSFGGVYPDGDIKHPYAKKGNYTVHASTTYGGEFSLDGGPWMSIDGTVDVDGPTQTLQVVTAKNRLVE